MRVKKMNDEYDKDYFMNGIATHKSLYQNYRWLPDLTIPMAESIIRACGISEKDSILDFGCAKGYVVKAFRLLGFRAYGLDKSSWACENADKNIKRYIKHGERIKENFDWIIAKDVLEHIADPSLDVTIADFFKYARKGIFVIVPLSAKDNGKYVVSCYEKDITHVQRLTLNSWRRKMEKHMTFPWLIYSTYRIEGVKDKYYRGKWKEGNGFLIANRCAAQEVK